MTKKILKYLVIVVIILIVVLFVIAVNVNYNEYEISADNFCKSEGFIEATDYKFQVSSLKLSGVECDNVHIYICEWFDTKDKWGANIGRECILTKK